MVETAQRLATLPVPGDPESRRARSELSHICQLRDAAKADIANAEQLRIEGNRLFSAAANTNDLKQKMAFLNRANHYYEAALAVNPTLNTIAHSAQRNIGAASFELARINLTNPNETDTLKQHVVSNFYAKAVQNFQQAIAQGKVVQSVEWKDKVIKQLDACIDKAVDFAIEYYPFGTKSRTEFLSRLIVSSCRGHGRIRVEQEIGTLLFHRALDTTSSLDEQIRLLERAKIAYNTCISVPLAHEPHIGPVIHEVKRLAEDRLQSVEMSLTIGKARLHLRNAESCLEMGISQDVELKMDIIMDALDLYFEACKVASSGTSPDLETEAIALAGIAKIYDKVFKNIPKSKEFAKRSLTAATACEPRDFGDCAWYKLVVDIMKRAQERVVVEEDQERQTYLQELKDVLAVIVDKFNLCYQNRGTSEDFIKFLYETHPSQDDMGRTTDPKALVSSDQDGSERTNLKNAIRYFHPDKTARNADRSRKVLREEICKYLNRIYESRFKGMS